MNTFPAKDYAALLADWVRHSQRHLYVCREDSSLICYGAGEHGHWGVHTHQKAMAAFAVAAADPSIDWWVYNLKRDDVYAQALSMLRYTLRTHLSGDFLCADGGQWGHNWIYALGIERMMHGVQALDERLTDNDRIMLRRVLLSECDWLLEEYPVKAGLIDNNKPESNIWNGAILYRTAILYPEHDRASEYRAKAAKFFVNGISIPSDEQSGVYYDGHSVRDLFVGANFFDSYALNHHKYLNVGYMVICLSNIAMLHFTCRCAGEAAPPAIYHHAKELWKLVRSLTYEDGRLLRIGGDTRVRYCYCQDYLLPVWAMVEDWLGEDCSKLERGWLEQLQQETKVNGDGSFLSERCGCLEGRSPVYYTRLESDRAAAISMALYWYRVIIPQNRCNCPSEIYSSWRDEYHGAVYVGGPKRLASFVWHSSQKPQGLCLPPDDSTMAEWRNNLAGRIEGIGSENVEQIKHHQTHTFDGGFLTYGHSKIKTDKFLAEGQQKETIGTKWLAFAALPDDSTVLCLQYAIADNRSFLRSVRGINWNVPNDLFNGWQRRYVSRSGNMTLRGGKLKESETISVGNWINADDRVGLVSLTPLTIMRPKERQIGIKSHPHTGTLYCDEVVSPCVTHSHWVDRGDILINTGFAMHTGSSKYTADLSKTVREWSGISNNEVISVCAKGADGIEYALIMSVSEHPITMPNNIRFIGDEIQVLNRGEAALVRMN